MFLFTVDLLPPPPSPLFTKLFFCTQTKDVKNLIDFRTTIRFSNCLKHDWLCISVHRCYNSLIYCLITTDSGTSMKQGQDIPTTCLDALSGWCNTCPRTGKTADYLEWYASQVIYDKSLFKENMPRGSRPTPHALLCQTAALSVSSARHNQRISY